MTKQQKEFADKQVILLTMQDVAEMTGWCISVVRKMFAYDKDFPAIKKGRYYQVELNAFLNYLSKRRVNEKIA